MNSFNVWFKASDDNKPTSRVSSRAYTYASMHTGIPIHRRQAEKIEDRDKIEGVASLASDGACYGPLIGHRDLMLRRDLPKDGTVSKLSEHG
jgi:hypothetical protein